MGKHMHVISNIDEAAQLADCTGCGDGVPIVKRSGRGYWGCKTARVNSQRRTPEDARASHLKRSFNITSTDYELLLAAQLGVCAICQRDCPTGRRLAVDHHHATGEVRGLLCQHCNTAIGLMQDDPERLLRAVQYLA